MPEERRDTTRSVPEKDGQAPLTTIQSQQGSSKKSHPSQSTDEPAPLLDADPPRASKALSGTVDGESFSYENLSWQLKDSGLQLIGHLRNGTGKDWHGAAFEMLIYDDADRSVGTTGFYVTQLNANATTTFTATIPDFDSSPSDLHARIRYRGGSNVQQIDPALHRFTSDAASLDIEAKIVDFQDGEVWLERQNSKRLKAKLELLNESDKAFVQRWIADNQNTLFRRFTTGAGSLNIEAKIADCQDGIVTLERSDGSQFKVKESALSENDRAFVQRWLAKR